GRRSRRDTADAASGLARSTFARAGAVAGRASMSVREMPAVAIVLVNYQAWHDTVECLDSILGLDYPRVHTFVVDNASPNGAYESIRRWCAAPRALEHWAELPGVVRWTRLRPGAAIAFRCAHARDGALPPANRDCTVTLLQSGANAGFAAGCNVGI